METLQFQSWNSLLVTVWPSIDSIVVSNQHCALILTIWNFYGVYILKDAHQYSLACLCSDCILHAWLLYHSVLYQEITAILTLTMGYHKCILQTTVLSVYVNYWVSILHSYVVHVCHFPFNSLMLSRRFACMSHSPVLHTIHPANEPIV